MNLERTSLGFKRIHLVRLLLLALAVNIIVFFIFVRPNRAQISNLQDRYGQLRSEVRAQKQQLQILHTRLARLQQGQKDLKHLYSQVLTPKRTGVTDIRLELETLLSSLQIQKQDFSYRYQIIKDMDLQQFTLGVPVQGSYRNIRQFINSIERSNHFLILERVNLSSEQSDQQLNLDFQLSTYLTLDGI